MSVKYFLWSLNHLPTYRYTNFECRRQKKIGKPNAINKKWSTFKKMMHKIQHLCFQVSVYSSLKNIHSPACMHNINENTFLMTPLIKIKKKKFQFIFSAT